MAARSFTTSEIEVGGYSYSFGRGNSEHGHTFGIERYFPPRWAGGGGYLQSQGLEPLNEYAHSPGVKGF